MLINKFILAPARAIGKKMSIFALITLAVVSLPLTSFATPISSQGAQLGNFLDGMNVTNLWLPKEHVYWNTGLEDYTSTDTPVTSHCSAFAATVADKLGVYLLHPAGGAYTPPNPPPYHKQMLLSNSQHDWLLGSYKNGSIPEQKEGQAYGWTQVIKDNQADTEIAAQQEANQGCLVVASYKNPAGKAGHIVVIRPSDKADDAIVSAGPQEIQAGGTNYQSTDVKTGFSSHNDAFSHNEILYFENTGDVLNGVKLCQQNKNT